MKQYTIKFVGIENFLEPTKEYLYDAIRDNDEVNIKSYREIVAFWENLQTNTTVSTLEEYFSILEKISEYTDGQYKIHNCGKWVCIGE